MFTSMDYERTISPKLHSATRTTHYSHEMERIVKIHEGDLGIHDVPRNPQVIERGLRRALAENPQLREVVSAIVFGDSAKEIHSAAGEPSLTVHRNGTPKIAIASDDLKVPAIRGHIRTQLLQALSLIAFPVSAPTNGIPHRRELYTRAHLERFLNVSDPRLTDSLSIVVQGGHRISPDEYAFVAAVAQEITRVQRNVTWITGCGHGVMEAPFDGANQARKMMAQRPDIRKAVNIGVTERGILAKERPNKYVDLLLTYPDIEQRMEAFIRLADIIMVFPGGVGTAEEIMQLLGIMMFNNGKHPNHTVAMHLLEQQGGTWMSQIRTLLQACFTAEELKKYINVFPDTTPTQYKRHLAEETGRNRNSGWNSILEIPERMQRPIGITDPNEFYRWMESIRLSRGEHDPFTLAATLREVFSASVELTVKQPHIAAQWQSQGQTPALIGDRETVTAMMQFIDSMYAQGRLFEGCPPRERLLRAAA